MLAKVTFELCNIQVEGEAAAVQSILDGFIAKGIIDPGAHPVQTVSTQVRKVQTDLTMSPSSSDTSVSPAPAADEKPAGPPLSPAAPQENYPPLEKLSSMAASYSEREWVLLYAFYAARYKASVTVTRDTLREQYYRTGRANKNRISNLTFYLKGLERSGEMREVSERSYQVTAKGKKSAEKLIERYLSSQPISLVSGAKPKKKRAENASEPKVISELDFSGSRGRVGLADYIKGFNLRYQKDVLLTIVYYLSQIYHYGGDITVDVMYTAWRTLGIAVPNIKSLCHHACASERGELKVSNGAYTITDKGINHVEQKLRRSR